MYHNYHIIASSHFPESHLFTISTFSAMQY